MLADIWHPAGMPVLTVSKRPDRAISLPTVSRSAIHSRDLAERLEAEQPSKNDRRSRVSAAAKFGGERSVERTAIGPLCRAEFPCMFRAAGRSELLAQAASGFALRGQESLGGGFVNATRNAKVISLKLGTSV
jgi:hypothetical protein